MQKFIDINLATISKAFIVDGTAKRIEFWYFILFTWIVDLFAGITDFFIPGDFTQNICSILLFVPTLTVAIRRMHDTDHVGWWLLFPFVNIVFLATPTKQNRWTSTFQ